MKSLQIGDVLHKTDELVDYVRRYVIKETDESWADFANAEGWRIFLNSANGFWIRASNGFSLYIPRDIAEGMKHEPPH